MKYLIAVVACILVVSAASNEIITDLETVGYHVDSGVSATDQCVSDAVADARESGGTLYIVVLVDEPVGGATAFASDTLVALGGQGTVFTVAPQSVDYASSDSVWTEEALDAALAEANTVASDNDVVRTFVNTLTGTTGLCANVSLRGRSGWGFLVMIVMIVAGAGYFTFRSLSASRRRKQE